MGYESTIIPKSIENYVSVEVVCLRFLDSCRFLSSSLDKLVKSLDCLPITEGVFGVNEVLKNKLSYPYEYFTLGNVDESLILTKEDFWSTIKQETPQMKKLTIHKKLLERLL